MSCLVREDEKKDKRKEEMVLLMVLLRARKKKTVVDEFENGEQAEGIEDINVLKICPRKRGRRFESCRFSLISFFSNVQSR